MEKLLIEKHLNSSMVSFKTPKYEDTKSICSSARFRHFNNRISLFYEHEYRVRFAKGLDIQMVNVPTLKRHTD